MAYGLKYELLGKSVPFGKNWKVRISRKDYTGPQIDRNVPSNPFVLKKDSAGTIRGTSLDFAIRAIADFEFIDFYTENSQDWLIELVDHLDVIVWKGFIIPEQYQEPYSPAPCTVSFTATDQLGLLKNFNYNASNSTLTSYLSIINSCLVNTGLSLGYAIAIAIKESRQDQNMSVLSEIFVNPQIYNGMTCYDVVVDILSHFVANITQQDGRWLIRMSAFPGVERVLYDPLGEYEGTQSAQPIKSLGPFGKADIYPTGGALAMTLATAERKVLISEDYRPKLGLLPPQDAASWTDSNTLPGWSTNLATIKRVIMDLPYFLVRPNSNGITYTSYAKTEIQGVNSTTDSIEFSFDYAFVQPVSISDPFGYRSSAKIAVSVELFDVSANKTWYLSSVSGWTDVLSRLEINDVKSSGSTISSPDWFNYKIFSAGIPANGTLTVKLYRPIVASIIMLDGYWGAAFKNVNFNILHDNVSLPTGLEYEVTLNKSTKAESIEIKLIGGDVPDIENKALCFDGCTFVRVPAP